MTDEHEPTRDADPETPAPQDRQPGHIDRRRFFRGAALLAVGGLSAPTADAQVGAPAGASAAAPKSFDASAQLEAQTNRVLRWAGRDPADWVRARAGGDHNVVIVGGGQSGVAIAYGLKRKGVGRVDVIDQAEAGQAGIWRTIARMHQLRTPKTLTPGPEGGNVALDLASALVKIARIIPEGARPTMPAGVFLFGDDEGAGILGRVRHLLAFAADADRPTLQSAISLHITISAFAGLAFCGVALALNSHQVFSSVHSLIEHVVFALS